MELVELVESDGDEEYRATSGRLLLVNSGSCIDPLRTLLKLTGTRLRVAEEKRAARGCKRLIITDDIDMFVSLFLVIV